MTEPETGGEVSATKASKAAAAKAAKAAKPKAPPKPRAPRKPRAPKAPPRMKIVWAVGTTGSEPVATFPYRDRAAAEARAQKVGGGCRVLPLKVLMEDPPAAVPAAQA